MRFSEFIMAESLDSAYPIKWVKKNQELWDGWFKTSDGHTVRLQLICNGPQSYEVMFARSTFDRKGSIDVTGEGDEFRIFATVIAMIKDFVDEMRPRVLIFTAFKGKLSNSPKGDSRTRLYTQLCKRFGAKNGYSFEKHVDSEFDDFALVRK